MAKLPTRPSIYRLTPNEGTLLELYDEGFSATQIRSIGGSMTSLYAALHKRELSKQIAAEHFAPTRATTLAKARHLNRPVSDVRVGAWK